MKDKTHITYSHTSS